MVSIAKSVTRIYSTVKKELVQIVRRPGAFLSLVLGPFLIMALFGAGYSGIRRPLETVLVIPEGLQLPRDASYFQTLVGPALRIVDIRSDPVSARHGLIDQTVDIVVIAPSDMEKAFREGRQSQIGVEYNQIDPVLKAYADFLAYRLAGEVNREILRRAVAEGESYALQRGVDPQVLTIPPEVVAAPTIAIATNIAPTAPNVLAFFGPAVFALILQHMAVTLSALSLVRERLSGTFELFRVSPVNALEILVGKYVGFGIIAAVISAIITGLLVGVLGIPMLGSPWVFGLVIALLVLASLGFGLLISVVSDSERQAVQLSLLVLLASVFFSGFVLPVQEFRPELQAVSYALPVTHGIRLLQDIMLRGYTVVEWQIGMLALVALVLFVATTLLLRGVAFGEPDMARAGEGVTDVIVGVIDAAAEATSARRARRRRRALRTLGLVLIAYGVIGIVLLAATTIGVAGPLAGITKLTELVEKQRLALIRALDTTSRTLDNAGAGIGRLDSSLNQASASTAQAASLSRGVSATMSQLSGAMGLSIFGAQPLVGLQGSFDEAARQLNELGTSIDGIGTALAANRTDIQVTKADIADLRTEVDGIARELRNGPKIEVSAGAVDGVRLILFGLIVWLGLLSLGITALGGLLVVRAGRSARSSVSATRVEA